MRNKSNFLDGSKIKTNKSKSSKVKSLIISIFCHLLYAQIIDKIISSCGKKTKKLTHVYHKLVH